MGMHRRIVEATSLSAALLALGIALPGAGLAEEATGGPDADAKPQGSMPAQSPEMAGQRQQLQQLQQKMGRLQKRLTEIQKQALDSNPELAQEREAFRTLLADKMREQGHDPQASVQRMKDLKGRLNNDEVEGQERRQVVRELRQEGQAMRQAQHQALQDQEVRAARSDLNESVVSAMNEQDPETQELIAEYKKTRQELRQLLQSAMPKAGPGGPRGGSPQ
ncbi:MAG: hypothetical protein GWO02_03900 [Gammaproteobacteria bacterium]|nr:hypothetical protein [Gammaproteobacteria bacterium]